MAKNRHSDAVGEACLLRRLTDEAIEEHEQAICLAACKCTYRTCHVARIDRRDFRVSISCCAVMSVGQFRCRGGLSDEMCGTGLCEDPNLAYAEQKETFAFIRRFIFFGCHMVQACGDEGAAVSLNAYNHAQTHEIEFLA